MIVTVRHNFETAHRLPFLEGKCQNIHGHSWWAEWLFDTEMDADGVTIEYGTLKKALRTWVDGRLDHGAMLGYKDPMRYAFEQDGSKTYIFTNNQDPEADPYTFDLPWPTVEAVAVLLSRVANRLMPQAGLCEVRVQETHVNSAIWRHETMARILQS